MPSDSQDSTKRFSNRVDYYIRYRPSYPEQVVDMLRADTGLTDTSVIADVGSGTGISSELFLKQGMTVYAIEPNAEMRHAAEVQLARYPGFHSVIGTAEATTLPERCVDYIVAGQAFHWFAVDQARHEFKRILRPEGWVVLMWNTRRPDSTPFLRAYEALLQEYGTDYQETKHRNIDQNMLAEFYGHRDYQVRKLYNEQRFDFEGVKGRLLSSSYAPPVGHPRHVPMVDELKRIFWLYQNDGFISFEYDTEVFFGHMR